MVSESMFCFFTCMGDEKTAEKQDGVIPANTKKTPIQP